MIMTNSLNKEIKKENSNRATSKLWITFDALSSIIKKDNAFLIIFFHKS